MPGPVKSPWTAPGQPTPPPAQPPPPAGQSGQVGTAWQGGTGQQFFGSVAGFGGGSRPNAGNWFGPPPASGGATQTAPSLVGAAAGETPVGAGVWDPETRSSVDPRGYQTVQNQNLGGYGAFAGRGSYPGDTRQPAAPTGTLSGPGALETAWDQHGDKFFGEGPAESFFNENRDAFTQPTNAEQYFAGVSGANAPRVENRADQAFDQYQREMPAMLEAPDLSSYYDVAEERAQRSLADAQAARGVFGSSVASGQSGDLSRGLRAEQANREADYNLARNADRRSTLSAFSDVGRGADITDLGNAANEMGWRATLGHLAGSADAGRTGRLGLGVSAAGSASGERRGGLAAGMSAAGMAQGAEESRERGALQDMTALYSMLSGLGLGTYSGMLGTDMDLMDGQISGGIAGASNAYNMDEANRQQFFGDVGAIGNVMTGLGSLGWRPFGPQPVPGGR